MTGFEVYKTYLALKQHFTKPDYDYHKYGGQVLAKYQTFERRRDRWHFEKIANKYQHESHLFLLANLIENKNFWAGNAMTKKCDECFNEWVGYKESGTYQFESDMAEIKSFCDETGKSFDSLFEAETGTHPIIYQLLVKKHIKYNTFCILESCIQFARKLDNTLQHDPIWEEESFKLKKTSAFCPHTRKHIEIVVDIF